MLNLVRQHPNIISGKFHKTILFRNAFFLLFNLHDHFSSRPNVTPEREGGVEFFLWNFFFGSDNLALWGHSSQEYFLKHTTISRISRSELLKYVVSNFGYKKGVVNQRHARTVRISQKWEELWTFSLDGWKELKKVIHKAYFSFFLTLIGTKLWPK